MKISRWSVPGLHMLFSCLLLGSTSPLTSASWHPKNQSSPALSAPGVRGQGDPTAAPEPGGREARGGGLARRSRADRERRRESVAHCLSLTRHTLRLSLDTRHTYEESLGGVSKQNFLQATSHLPVIHTPLHQWMKARCKQRIRLVVKTLQFYQRYLQSQKMADLLSRVDPSLSDKLYSLILDIRDLLHLLSIRFRVSSAPPSVSSTDVTWPPGGDWHAHSQALLLLRGLESTLQRTARELTFAQLDRKSRHRLIHRRVP